MVAGEIFIRRTSGENASCWGERQVGEKGREIKRRGRWGGRSEGYCAHAGRVGRREREEEGKERGIKVEKKPQTRN